MDQNYKKRVRRSFKIKESNFLLIIYIIVELG
jgi:hypothetical protein